MKLAKMRGKQQKRGGGGCTIGLGGKRTTWKNIYPFFWLKSPGKNNYFYKKSFKLNAKSFMSNKSTC